MPTPAPTSSNSHSARVATALGVTLRPASANDRAAASQNGQPSPQTSGCSARVSSAIVPAARQRVRRRHDGEQAVLADRIVVQVVQILRLLRQQDDLVVAPAQGLAQLDRALVAQRDLGLGVAGHEAAQGLVQHVERHAAGDAELEAGAAQREEAGRPGPRRPRLLDHLAQMRLHDPPELGEMGLVALAIEQRAAHLLLEQLDGTGQRGLGDVAPLRGAREIERLAQRHEVAGLVHLHGRAPAPSRHGR